MIAAFIWALDARPQLQLDVTRDRTLYRENMQGQIENMYRLKLINKTQQPRARWHWTAAPSSCRGPREISWHRARSPICRSAWRCSPTPMVPAMSCVSGQRPAEPDSRVSTPSTFVAPIAALRQ